VHGRLSLPRALSRATTDIREADSYTFRAGGWPAKPVTLHQGSDRPIQILCAFTVSPNLITCPAYHSVIYFAVLTLLAHLHKLKLQVVHYVQANVGKSHAVGDRVYSASTIDWLPVGIHLELTFCLHKHRTTRSCEWIVLLRHVLARVPFPQSVPIEQHREVWRLLCRLLSCSDLQAN
jgi:hypothetical protein